MKIRIILSLLLVITIACSKDSAEPETLSPESTISMALDYQSREYELGEVIEATLTITEKKAATNFFLLNTSCNGGKAAATVDGRELQWQTEQQIPYEIVNDEFSSKILHLKITPQAGALAEQSLNFRIYVTSADGTEISTKSMPTASTLHQLQRKRYIKALRLNWNNSLKSRYAQAKSNSPGSSP